MRKRTIRPEIVKFIVLPTNNELSQQSDPNTSKAIVMRDFIAKVGKKNQQPMISSVQATKTLLFLAPLHNHSLPLNLMMAAH